MSSLSGVRSGDPVENGFQCFPSVTERLSLRRLSKLTFCQKIFVNRTRCSAIAERESAAGCVIVLAKSGRLELGDNILRTLYVYLQPLWYNRPENVSNSVEKTQNKGSYSVQGHWKSSRSVPIERPYVTSYQWLIVTNILSRTVLELLQLIVQIFDTAFLSPLFWERGLRTT